MTDGIAIAVIGTLGMMTLVCSAIAARHRAGQPVVRYALMWAALIALAFGVAHIASKHPLFT